MFIKTSKTPNPRTLKFLPDRPVIPPELGEPAEYRAPEDLPRSPLAAALFAAAPLTSVFLGRAFIAVTRQNDASWEAITPGLLEAIMDHYLSGRPAIERPTPREGQDDDAIVRQIKAILDERIRPAVAEDGGDIVFQAYADGIVSVTLRGACAGCPNATATLKMGVERLLKRLIPEIRGVRQVEPVE
jgi:Fe-S cluster biogenesis protein NfuA